MVRNGRRNEPNDAPDFIDLLRIGGVFAGF